jgi:hypothetical protein
VSTSLVTVTASGNAATRNAVMTPPNVSMLPSLPISAG